MNDTRVAEVADGIYQLTTYLPDIDFSVNQHVVLGDQPLLSCETVSTPDRRERRSPA